MTTGENEPTQYMNQRQGGFKSRNVNYSLSENQINNMPSPF
jgi:hypothetical protein